MIAKFSAEHLKIPGIISLFKLLHKPYFSVKYHYHFLLHHHYFLKYTHVSYASLVPENLDIGEQYAIRERCLCKLNVNLDNIQKKDTTHLLHKLHTEHY